MKYLQKISLFLISLSIVPTQSKETTPLSNTTDDLKELVQAVEASDKNNIKESLETINDENVAIDENINAYQAWENHLKTLDQNWSNNTPDSNWISQATTLANTAIGVNSGLISQLQNEFLAAINGKIQQGESLTPELLTIINTFNDSIGQTTQDEDEDEQDDENDNEKQDEDESDTQDDKKDVITEESLQETSTEHDADDEDKQEVDQTSSSEITATSTDSSNTSDTQSETKDTSKLREQWQAALHKLATQGTSQADAEQLITQARTMGQQLVDEGGVDASTINNALANALQDRKKNKKLYAISMQDSSDDDIARAPEVIIQESIPQEHPELQQNIRNLEQKVREQEDLIQKQTVTATKDKQQLSAEMQELARQVASTKTSRSTISPDQAEKLINAQINAIKAEEKKKAAAAQKQFEEKLLIAAAKKTTTEKGIIGSAMDAVRNWWSGKSYPESQKESLNKQQEALLNEMVSHYTDEATKTAIRTAWISLHDALIAIKEDKYWDSLNKKPNNLWIKTIKDNIEILTITHQVMPLLNACDIVIQVLNAQKDMTVQNRAITIEAIRKDLQNKEFAAQKSEREKAAQERLERETAAEKKKRIAEEQLRIKIAEDQAAERKALEQRSKQQFVQQKAEWDLFIKNLSEQKEATEAQNDASTLEAIKKARALLNLTFYDPSQNTYTLEQQLKEEFTNALLKQKKGNKNNTEQMRIHHNMDQFNTAINAIVEELEKA